MTIRYTVPSPVAGGGAISRGRGGAMAGKLVHVEIGATDADRAQGFWSGVFGWEVGPAMSPEMDYRMFRTGEDQGGAIFASEEAGNLRAHSATAHTEATTP